MNLKDLKLGQSEVVSAISKKKLEKLSEDAFNKLGHGIQFNIMDLGTISKAYEDEFVKSQDAEKAEHAMSEAMKKYRHN